ncbi:hypothetical protein [Leucobacter luti]|uniref:hypothetical protein n=1 Tax=Leucobacter luti TaxID=340320 RepID=UPI00104FB105|nr:hypothetical protein [Leucobacter luti]MCW2288918.1 hypothetical protein [Leucobacter luti]
MSSGLLRGVVPLMGYAAGVHTAAGVRGRSALPKLSGPAPDPAEAHARSGGGAHQIWRRSRRILAQG